MSDWVNRSCMKKPTGLLLMALILPWILQGCAQQGLRVYFVRHAEAGHNVVKEWKDKPKSEWPAYVGNANMFTPKGERQAQALPEKLKGIQFDLIAVCPYWRTRHTILPYLQATGQKAELWPELEETSFVPIAFTAAGAKPPEPNPTLFKGVNNFGLPDSEKAYFYFRDGDKKYLEWQEKGNKQLELANDLALSRKAIDLIKTRFGNSPKSILLVGHGDAGSTLLRLLTTSKSINPDIDNTGLWMAEEQPNGTFKLKILNGKSYRGK